MTGIPSRSRRVLVITIELAVFDKQALGHAAEARAREDGLNDEVWAAMRSGMSDDLIMQLDRGSLPTQASRSSSRRAGERMPSTNVEFVTELMEFSANGALIQAFVMLALGQYTRRVVAMGSRRIGYAPWSAVMPGMAAPWKCGTS